ncbi:MAG: glycosyltransferase [Lachnospiraceae bacterium]|nr:glycosyltransferase [Lachnospiraceae bacterium]
MKNKRVLFINSIVGTGSTGRIIAGLCRVLKENGADALVCYGRGGAPKEPDTYRIGPDLDVYAHGLISRITDKHGLYSKGVTKRLIEKIEEYSPELIHLHNLHGYYLNYEILMRYLKTKNVPIIWTLHDCWAFTGHCTHFEYIKCDRYKSGCHDCMQLAEYPRSLLMDASKSNYSVKKEVFTGFEEMQIVTPSRWLKEKVSESFLRDYPAEVIPTGIDLNTFKPTESDIRERYGIKDRILILGAANPWRDRKGLDDFISLASKLPEEYAIAMIGLKKKQLKLLPENVIAMEKTDSVQEMAQWYTAADMYVNLTREDTFPTTNLESLACGTPVITYKAGGSPESLDETCGRVVPVDDLEGVIQKIKELGHKTSGLTEASLKRARVYDKDIRFKEYYSKCYSKWI